jgi:hypothetical protein
MCCLLPDCMKFLFQFYPSLIGLGTPEKIRGGGGMLLLNEGHLRDFQHLYETALKSAEFEV